jgi:hypothetical protein
MDLDPDPHWEYRSGSRRAKSGYHKSEEISILMFSFKGRIILS